MLRTLAVLSVFALAAYSQNAASIAKKVAERYQNLDGYWVEGKYEITTSNNREGTGASSGHFSIAAFEKSRKLRVNFAGSDFTMVLVSDGATTWTYLPKQKQYTKVDAVTDGDQGQDEDDTTEADSRALLTYQLAIKRYGGFDQWRGTELARDQEVKTNSGKRRCWVLVTKFPDRVERFWVDQQQYVIWRSEATYVKPGVTYQTTIFLKRFENEMLDKTVFTFAPNGDAKLVDELNIPGTTPSLVGKQATDFVLKDLHGEAIRLSDMRGKIVLLDFWATWCRPCRHELPTINKLAAELKGRGVVVLGINDEGTETVKSFNKKNNYTFDTLQDNNRKVHRAYKANAIPMVFVIAKDGTIVKHFVGGREESELLAGIKAAEAR